jgi:hypothetical protein
MKNSLAVLVLASVTGCGLMGPKEPRAEDGGSISTEVRHGSAAPKAIHVAFNGPEALTRRFSKFFAIAADDYGLKIVNNERDADASVAVTITEEDVQTETNARVLRAGFLLQNAQTTVEYCEGIGSEPSPDLEILDYSRYYARNLVAEFKKKQPNAKQILLAPVKGVDPYFLEQVKRELVREGYILVTTAGHPDATLRSVGTTSEPFGARVIRRRLHIKTSGSVSYTYDASTVLYKSLQRPFPERAAACQEQAQGYLSPTHSLISDNFWNAAAVTAKTLAKL